MAVKDTRTSKQRVGFTLIELLVVIAIIGILSSIVLASLYNSRINAADATIKSNLIAIRSESEIYFDTNGYSYGASAVLCGTLASMFRQDLTMYSALTAISNITSNPNCRVNSTSWAVNAQLKSGSYWCVDYTGASVTEGSNAINTPAGQYTCF